MPGGAATLNVRDDVSKLGNLSAREVDPFPAVQGQFTAPQLRPFVHLGRAAGLALSSSRLNGIGS